ncbi:10397_t:CDS:2, partial [Cetraspora pellucida]
RFIVENLEQHFAIFQTCVIAPKDPNHEFQADKILLNVPICMFPVLVNCEPKECGGFTYFDAECYQYNLFQDVQRGISSVVSDNRSDIDLITKDVKSTTSLALKRLCITTLRSSKQGISSSTVINKSATSFLTSVASVNTTSETVQIQKDEDVYAEDVSEDDNNLKILCEQEVEGQKKKIGELQKELENNF